MMICCEENPPYGPATSTANMFLQLLSMSYQRVLSLDEPQNNDIDSISITVYHAQHQDYPTSKKEWSSFDGVIIPGSLSSAYDTHIPWIQRLHDVIRKEIHANQRKTLAVCFGHQSFAHALGELDKSSEIQDKTSGRRGEAVCCPSGKKAGRKSFKLTTVGSSLFAPPHDNENVDLELLYTHGDMVNTLPSVGLSLGGNSEVPIQSAAYFASEEYAIKFKRYADSLQQRPMSSKEILTCHDQSELPYAFTFQAHPEYISPDGFNINFLNILSTMESLEHIDSITAKEANADARRNFHKVQMNSLDAIVSVGLILGWF
jgi:GMP synthase-like glutamine amidotransferase